MCIRGVVCVHMLYHQCFLCGYWHVLCCCLCVGFLDWVPKKMQRVGCMELLNTVQRRVQPKLHVFGHIHEGTHTHTHTYTLSFCMNEVSHTATQAYIFKSDYWSCRSRSLEYIIMTRLWILAMRLYLILVIYYTVRGTAVAHPGQGDLEALSPGWEILFWG